MSKPYYIIVTFDVKMNHTMVTIIVLAASCLFLATNLGSTTVYASIPQHGLSNHHIQNTKSQLVNQQFLCYRSPGCHGMNLAEQVSGKGNSVTGWGDQSSNIQQNQTTQPQQQQQQQQQQPSNNISSNSAQGIPVGISLPH
jgi:hypothetical protein